jgi:hypothetical protein
MNVPARLAQWTTGAKSTAKPNREHHTGRRRRVRLHRNFGELPIVRVAHAIR